MGILHQIVGTPQVTKRLLQHIPLQFQPTKRLLQHIPLQFQPTQRPFRLTLLQFKLTQPLYRQIKRQLLLTQLQILITRLLTREPTKILTLPITKSQVLQPLRKPLFKNLRPTLLTLTVLT